MRVNGRATPHRPMWNYRSPANRLGSGAWTIAASLWTLKPIPVGRCRPAGRAGGMRAIGGSGGAASAAGCSVAARPSGPASGRSVRGCGASRVVLGCPVRLCQGGRLAEQVLVHGLLLPGPRGVPIVRLVHGWMAEQGSAGIRVGAVRRRCGDGEVPSGQSGRSRKAGPGLALGRCHVCCARSAPPVRRRWPLGRNTATGEGRWRHVVLPTASAYTPDQRPVHPPDEHRVEPHDGVDGAGYVAPGGSPCGRSSIVPSMICAATSLRRRLWLRA